jgi:subtilisin family serine protease
MIEAKLDLELRALLEQHQAGHRGVALGAYRRQVRQAPAARPGRPSAGAAAAVFLAFTGDLEPLRALGFRPATVGRRVATGTVDLDRLADLAAHPNVVRLKLADTTRPLLDKSVPAIRADVVHRPPLESRGEGVVIGVIDAGIDFRHPCFVQADGLTSRILFIWDQTRTEDIGEDPPTAEGFDYGVEYDQDDINDALEGFDGACPHEEEPESEGHGTHVAGVAAGDGSVAGNCRGTDTFVGVAPDADLIIVRYDRTDTGIVDGISYVFQKAAARGAAAVVNISQGKNLGPHDGTSEFDDLVSDLLDTPGRAVVFSSGNETDEDIHAQDTLTPTSVTPQTLEILVKPSTDGPVGIDIWYPGAESLGVTVQAPGAAAAVPAVPVTSPTATVALAFAGLTTTGTIDHELSDLNLDHHVRIRLRQGTGPEVARGRWRVLLHGVPTAAMTYHCWINTGGDSGGVAIVSPQREPNGALNALATSERVITVGAFATEGERKGHLDPSSGRGPTRDGRRKPDVVAPGVGITSARALARTEDHCCCDCCVDMYVDADGTSMAAPHVTGVIALMLENDSTLTWDQIRTTLRDTARAPAGITPLPVLPNDDWGHGIVNAEAAVNDVAPTPVFPIGGGSGADPAVIPRRRATTPSARSPASPVAELRQRALATPAGQLYAALVSRHFSEIRGLINANRRVATVWHRTGGPALVRRLLREASGRRPRPRQAPEPGGANVERFFAALARYASPTLRRDLADHGQGFAAFVLAGLSPGPDGRGVA